MYHHGNHPFSERDAEIFRGIILLQNSTQTAPREQSNKWSCNSTIGNSVYLIRVNRSWVMDSFTSRGNLFEEDGGNFMKTVKYSYMHIRKSRNPIYVHTPVYFTLTVFAVELDHINH